ncbi:MAG: NAD(P)-dependent oxidoreductase [Gammaproteobacteria bacterium]|nr:NAD(P)-dependent oxidoreductase [Gammaproteobacteria bacterium]
MTEGKMDKVVVIGGSGFMGSHTADELSKRGFGVTIFDHIESPWIQPSQTMVVGDILDRDAVASVLDGAKYVYHFAGIADIGEARNRPYDTINLNVMGATTALEAAVQAGVSRFLYASTMYVYSPYGSFYRASKQAAEAVVETFHELYGLNYNFLRYGSLYGPRAQSWNGLRRYIEQVIRFSRLEYRGTGKERREYIHVLDAARLSVNVLDEEHKNQAVIVTGQQVLNSKELIEMIFEIAGVKQNVVFSDDHIDTDHYTMTPYRYTPKNAKKIVPEEFVDIGQGILDTVEEIHAIIDDKQTEK